ncbi:MAG: tRNA glutamyl-Q(34) synthetase GluQRS [Pseudomonadota bacterium]
MKAGQEFRTRFAPSPTGRLHLGHAYSAREVWRFAAEIGGHVLLRIEDIDTTRCRPEYTTTILEDLAWLGFDWPQAIRIQSQHFADYEAVVRNLSERGLTYRCFRTRAEVLEETSSDQAFIGSALPKEQEEQRLERGDPYAWRLSLAACRDVLGSSFDKLEYVIDVDGERKHRKADPQLHGDIIIARKDSPSAYHIASTHDDALQGITDVIRGEDLIDAPHIQTLLQILMGWPQPVYHHHRLLKGQDGKRLSKREASLSLAELRADGHTPESIWARIDQL